MKRFMKIVAVGLISLALMGATYTDRDTVAISWEDSQRNAGNEYTTTLTWSLGSAEYTGLTFTAPSGGKYAVMTIELDAILETSFKLLKNPTTATAGKAQSLIRTNNHFALSSLASAAAIEETSLLLGGEVWSRGYYGKGGTGRVVVKRVLTSGSVVALSIVSNAASNLGSISVTWTETDNPL
jgi:hypothetical protein